MSDISGIYPKHKSDEWFRQVYALGHEEFEIILAQCDNAVPLPQNRVVALENLCLGYRRKNPATGVFNTTDGKQPLATIFDINPDMYQQVVIEKLKVSKEQWLRWYFNRENLPEIKARFLRRFAKKWFGIKVASLF